MKIDEDFEELLRKIKDRIIMKKRGRKLRIRRSGGMENVERNRKRWGEYQGNGRVER